jgi:uncharacterized membrane protein
MAYLRYLMQLLFDNMIEWVIISLVLVCIIMAVGIVAAVVLQKKRKGAKKKDVNYRAIFGAGLAFIPSGIAIAIATRNFGLMGITGLGVVYVILGLQHKDEWKNKKK